MNPASPRAAPDQTSTYGVDDVGGGSKMTPVFLSDQLKRRPVNRAAVDALKAEMLREVESEYRKHILGC